MKKILLIIGIVWLLLKPNVGYAASNPYPKTQTFEGVVSTPCTRVAWQEVYDRLGIALPSWGNAVDWYRNAANAGYQVGMEAKANSVAVYSGYYGYGHVAFVVSVDEEMMHLVENKASGEGKMETNRSKGIGSGEASGIYLIGFIYVTEPKTATNSSSSSSSSSATSSLSSNSSLKSLEIAGLEFDFQKDVYSYNLEVPYEVENINVVGEAQDSKANIDGLKEYHLEVGENYISIKVVAEDKSSSIYNLLVVRKPEELADENVDKEDTLVESKEKEAVKNYDNKGTIYYLIAIGLGIIILGAIIVVIVTKSKKRKRK